MALLFIEVLVRIEENIFGVLKDSTYAVSIIERHDQWHHQPVPNINVKFSYPFGEKRNGEKFYNKFTNSESCYESVDISDNLNKELIIITGDSFTEGYHYEDSISAKLNKKNTNKNQLAFNCSSSSYAIHPIFVRLQLEIINFKPSIYVLNIDPTDVFDDVVRYSSVAEYLDQEKTYPIKLHRFKKNRLTPIGSYLRKKSIFFNHLVERLDFMRVLFGLTNEISDEDFIGSTLTYENIYSYYNEDYRTKDKIDDINKYLNILESFSEYLESNNVKLIISIYPFREHFADVSSLESLGLFKFDDFFFKKIQEFTLNNNIDLINAYEYFKDYNEDLNNIYFKNDQHFNINGQRIWTDFVSESILKLI